MAHEDLETKFTGPALDTIQKMGDEVRRLRMEMGEDSPEAIKAARSLALSLAQMLNLQPTHVSADGGLSLFCTSRMGIVFGVNYTGASMHPNGAGEWSVNS